MDFFVIIRPKEWSRQSSSPVEVRSWPLLVTQPPMRYQLTEWLSIGIQYKETIKIIQKKIKVFRPLWNVDGRRVINSAFIGSSVSIEIFTVSKPFSNNCSALFAVRATPKLSFTHVKLNSETKPLVVIPIVSREWLRNSFRFETIS